MPERPLDEILRDLPYSMRERVDGYVSTVAAQATAIFRDAGVLETPELRSQFLFVCGVRKLWAIVDADHRMLTASLEIMRPQGVASVSIGATEYKPSSPIVLDVRRLHNGLRRVLLEAGVFDLVRERDLTAVVKELSGERSRST